MTAYDQLAQIIPPDQALANKALAVSLQQITGISQLTLPAFAKAVSSVQTMYGLPLVNAQTAPISQSTANYWLSYGDGSGNHGTITVSDVIGAAAGIPYTVVFTDIVSVMSTMNLSYLNLIYTTMDNCLNGVYGSGTLLSPVVIPSGLPAAGTYATINIAMSTGLIPAANTEIANLVATYPQQTTKLNTGWNTMVSHLATEFSLQARSNINIANYVNNSPVAMYGFIFSLPTYGQDTAIGGTAEYIEAVADTATLTGQAIIGVLRQGQTEMALNAAGIGTSNNPSAVADPAPAQASLMPAQYPYPQSTSS
jgi:hypothetical protein